MPLNEKMQQFHDSIRKELYDNILSFWATHCLDEEGGGFIGRMTSANIIEPMAQKGLILNTRLLWTFSTAYRVARKAAHLILARRAFAYLRDYFLDQKHGGYYWMVDHEGRPVDDKKRVYGQAFAVYALSEYHRATSDIDALRMALDLFALLDARARDSVNAGYMETFERDWSPTSDMRLSAKDMNVAKSMNTHLHLLEAYTNLHRVWLDEHLRRRLTELITIFRDHIINPKTNHFILFFDKTWRPQSSIISYGHDIEGSWLLTEASEAIGVESLTTSIKKLSLAMAAATLEEGQGADGGLDYELDPGKPRDSDRHWWPQAETVVGFLNAWQLTGKKSYLNATLKSWAYIQKYIVDSERGEWFWKVSKEGIPDMGAHKVSEWKSPYHNSRMCFEVLARLEALKTFEATNAAVGNAN